MPTNADRQRAYRLRRHERDAILAAELIAESSQPAVRRALAALPASALTLLVARLTERPTRIS